VGFFDRHPAVANLLLFAAGCAVSICIAAATLRLGWLRAPWLDTLKRTYELKAGPYRAERILVLGDSFLARWRIDTHLKKDLEAWASEWRIGLVNTAEYGIGPAGYYERIKKVAPEFEPDLVLLFYFVGNDLTDVQYYGLRIDRARRRRGKPIIFPDKCRIANSRLTPGERRLDWDAMLAHGIDPELVARARGAANARSSNEERINPWLLQLSLRAPRYLLDNILIDTKCNQLGWMLGAEFLVGIFEIAREAGADLHLIALPATVQIDRSHFDFYRRAAFSTGEQIPTSVKPVTGSRFGSSARRSWIRGWLAASPATPTRSAGRRLERIHLDLRADRPKPAHAAAGLPREPQGA
jgi:hypothetical protein